MNEEKKRLEEIKKKLEERNIAYTDYRPWRKDRFDDVLMEDAESDVLWLLSQLAEKDRLQRLFDIQHERMKHAVALWQAVTGKKDILPDLGDLLTWLLDERDNWKARAEKAEKWYRDLCGGRFGALHPAPDPEVKDEPK